LERFYRLILLLSFGSYCCIFPGSLFLLVTNQVPEDMAYMASVMLFMVGVAALGWLLVNFGLAIALKAGMSLVAIGFLVEMVGEKTGFPFGPYVYTDELAPKLLNVPLPILFAWMMIIIASFFTARHFLFWLKPDASRNQLVLLATVLAVSSDLLMEPVAFKVKGYWLWERGMDFYYGVPFSNFIAWTVISFIMLKVLTHLLGKDLKPVYSEYSQLNYYFVPPALYYMNLLVFTLVNFSNQFYLASFIGVIVGLPCLFLLLRGINLHLNPLIARPNR
jgi:putative membrane protein